ncbi:hypothetical protein MPLA_2130060 [Mesorhizobium sp. ORS 3359]|nr:hypothetical protein MPLA_2130060 [Mesorhizobium sp. ORS 3359]
MRDLRQVILHETPGHAQRRTAKGRRAQRRTVGGTYTDHRPTAGRVEASGIAAYSELLARPRLAPWAGCQVIPNGGTLAVFQSYEMRRASQRGKSSHVPEPATA